MLQNVFALLLILPSLAIYASDASQSSVTKPDDNVYSEDKLNITVTADQPKFVIKLKSNPTTGYSWFLREYDTSLISPVKHLFQQPEQKLIGAPGYELWTFRVKLKGFTVPQQTTIRMIYARPWQGADNSTQLVFRVTTQGK
jgi:inhibitor of cysteine peptidase